MLALRRLPTPVGGRRSALRVAVRAGSFRDRLTGRTPRSERGDRGSTPCPGASRADSSTGRAPVLQTGGCWFESSSAYSHRRRIARVVEHLPDKQEAAGSTPAPPTPRGRSSAGRALV